MAHSLWCSCSNPAGFEVADKNEVVEEERIQLPGVGDEKIGSPTDSQPQVQTSSTRLPSASPASARSELGAASGRSGQPVSPTSCARSAYSLSPSLDPDADPALRKLPADVREQLTDAEKQRLDGYPFQAEQQVFALVTRLEGEGLQDLVADIRETLAYQELVEQMTEANKLLEVLLDDEGWTCQKSAEGIHVWTRPEPGTDLVTVRLAGVVEGGFDFFTSIGKELQLVKTWMPGVKTSYVIKNLNLFDQVGYYCWKFPLISARDFLIEEKTMTNDEEGYCLVHRYPPLPRADMDLPQIQKNHIRAAITKMCSFSAPIGVNAKGERCNFSISVVNVDLKIPLPSYLVNHLSVKMGHQSFRELRNNVRKAQDTSSPFSKSVRDANNEAYYGRMRGLEKARDKHPVSCLEEVLATGWIKDPAERRKMFARSEGAVLVPMTPAT